MSFSKERKRTRGEIACAECRRSKARCDKQVPCSTCIKRGCDVLCPNGTIPPGEGSRFVGAAEEYLRRKIMKMEEHMRSLEDALVIIGGSVKPYPPLDDEWPNHEAEQAGEAGQDSVTPVNEFSKYGLTDALGSMYLDEGPICDPALPGTSGGGSESLLLHAKAVITESPSPANHAEEIDSSFFPSEINMFYQAFPFTLPGIPTEPVQDLIESYLPPLPRAMALFETFVQSTSWMFRIVSRQHIMDDLIPTVYEHASDQASIQPKPYVPRDIALLFIVFAIGALMDPSLPPYNVEGQQYHILSRAAMCLESVFAQRSVVTIKTLNLMSIYNGMCGIESKLETSFSLLNLAAQVALQTGFHKDPSVWGITGRDAYERRTYFWNLLAGTLWQSLVSGRPPVIMPSLINCYIPAEEDEGMYQSGEVPSSFGSWNFSFIKECLVPVVEVTQNIRPPTYDSILALDHKIREFSAPHASSSKHVSKQMQVIVRNQMRELSLLFLHRGFFAQALEDFPCDPMKSPFHQSFLAAYQSAIGILSAIRRQLGHQPTSCVRVWRFWSFASSAAIIIGTVAMKRLSVKLEPEPFEQLDLACTLFREGAHTSVRARKALPILLRLRQEAVKVRSETLRRDPGTTDFSPEGDYHWEACDDRGTPMDTSEPLTSHSTPGIPHSGSSSGPAGNYMQTLPVPVEHLPLAKMGASEEGPYTSVVGAPLEWQGPYRETPSPTTLGPHGLPSTPYADHPPAYGFTSEDPWTSFMYDRSGSHAHSHPP